MAKKKITAKPPWEAQDKPLKPPIVAPVPKPNSPTPNKPELPAQDTVDAFLLEYVKDFSIKNAALRTQYTYPDMGGAYDNPLLTAVRILDSPYGQWRIDQLMTELDHKSPVKRRHIVRKLLTEGNDPNINSADRQRALNSAADLQGQKVIKSELDVTTMKPTINLTANKPDDLTEDGD